MRTDFTYFLLSTMTKCLQTLYSSNFLSCMFQVLFDSLHAFQYSRNLVEEKWKVLKWEQNIPCKIPNNSGRRSLSDSPLFVLKIHSKFLTMELQQITHSLPKILRNIWYFTHTHKNVAIGLLNMPEEIEAYWFVTKSSLHHCLSPIALGRCLKRAIHIIHFPFVKSSILW